MPYLRQGGAKAFRADTAKTTLNVGLIKVKVSGTNLVPIYDSLVHYEAVMNFGATEVEKALCSVISKCKKWITLKGPKAAAAMDPNATVVRRHAVISQLLAEAVNALHGSNAEASRAFNTYQMRKAHGQIGAAQTLAQGYVNERTAYIQSGKTRSLAGSLIDEIVDSPTSKLRTQDKLSPKAAAAVTKRFGGREFGSLSVKDWQKIDKIADELDGHRLETRYMTRRERLNYMLESDGAGGLRYLMGARSATTPGNSSWPYAMDEWGNIYTADDQTETNGYAMFNHSSFTSGDLIVCAGFLQINAAGKLKFVDNASGHYKPTREQLAAVVTILRDDYHVDLNHTDISTFVPRKVWVAGALDRNRFLNGQDPMPPLPRLPGQ